MLRYSALRAVFEEDGFREGLNPSYGLEDVTGAFLIYSLVQVFPDGLAEVG
jgi:hypothetical protein